jgi:CRISPR-associated protein Csm4
MGTYIYKLKFEAPLLISSDPLSLEKPEVIIHSDTLFSAIANTYLYLFRDIGEEFFTDPFFTISSAFPFFGDTLFVKRPRVRRISNEELGNFAKKLKKVQFVSWDIFKKLAQGDGGLKISEEDFKGEFLFSSTIEDEMFVINEIPRCRISALTNETDIFYSHRVEFASDAGLFFFVEFKKETDKTHFDSALQLLGEMGIGGERSLGLGRFQVVETKEFQIKIPDSDSYGYFTNLSLYHPRKSEIKEGILEGARYDFITRQNWIFSDGPVPLRSKSARMFLEGSIFKNIPDAKGDLTDTTPQIAEAQNYLLHRVYRSGLLFKYPIALKA